MTTRQKAFWFIAVVVLCALASCRSVGKDMPDSTRMNWEVTSKSQRRLTNGSNPTLPNRGVNSSNFPVLMLDKSGRAPHWGSRRLQAPVSTQPLEFRGSLAAGEIISEALLDAIAQIESSGNPNAVGDGGKALGLFQFHRAAWGDARRREPLLEAYETGALKPDQARRAARIYLNDLAARYDRATHRSATPADLYAAYNIGFSGYSKRGFQISRCPQTTQRAIKKLNELMK